MNKIIALNGAKNTGKDYIAEKLSLNSDVAYIRPYTDKKELSTAEIAEGYHQVSKEELDIMLETEEVLSLRVINGNRWAFFKSQLTKAYNVLIVDDYALCDVRENWANVYSIKVKSNNEKESDRVGVYLYDHDFDEVFHYNYDDYDELEARIE